MSATVFLFPGQSSRYPEMIAKLLELGAPFREVIAEASEVLHRDLAAWYAPSNTRMFEQNRDVQVGVFLANHLHRLGLERAGLRADLSLGLSLGEYNHLVDIGALDFSAALALVDRRGELYDQGPDGVMASIFPLELEVVLEAVERHQALGEIAVANLNSPVQNVIAGERAAVNAALTWLMDEHSVEGVIIEERVPMHTPRFLPVAAGFRPVLAKMPWRTPTKPYVSNVLGRAEEMPSPERLVELLSAHVYRPVLFRAAIDEIVRHSPDARFIEVGPKAVLYNLLGKRWLKNPRFRTDATGAQPPTFTEIAQELRRVA